MSLSLFRSVHVVLGALLSCGILIAAMTDGSAGALAGEPSRELRLGTGWVAALAFFSVGAYALRKYAHRGGYSPEFLVRTDYAKIEAATREIKRLTSQVARDGEQNLKVVRRRAAKVIRAAGAHRVLRAVVRSNGPSLEIDLEPTEPLGRVAVWLGAHIGYGLLFAVAVAVHGGGFGHSLISKGLIWTSIAVVGSGVVGAVMWSAGPRWLTREERDLTIEECFALRRSMGQKYDQGVAALDKEQRKRLTRARAAGDLEGVEDGAALRDLLVLRQQLARARSEAVRLGRVRWMMVGWKLVHGPAVLVLATLIGVHVAMIWRY